VAINSLAADRASCCRATANQLRRMLHTATYWLLWSLRSPMPKRSTSRVAQFDTLRLRLVKLATRVVALKTRVMLHLPSVSPDQAILRLALERTLRLVCRPPGRMPRPNLRSAISQPRDLHPTSSPKAGISQARPYNPRASDPARFQSSSSLTNLAG
jgi:hypothetical protein